MPAFLDEVFKPFYVACSKAKEKYQFGQFFRTHCYYPHQLLEIWRPDIFDSKLGIASNFKLVPAPADAFKRALPMTART